MEIITPVILLLVLIIAVVLGFYGDDIYRPKTKDRSSTKIVFRNRWYPGSLAIFACLGIAHNLREIFQGHRGVYLLGFALFSALLTALLTKRPLLLPIINLWLIVTLLSAIARSIWFVKGDCSAQDLTEIVFTLLIAALAFLGKKAYVACSEGF